MHNLARMGDKEQIKQADIHDSPFFCCCLLSSNLHFALCPLSAFLTFFITRVLNTEKAVEEEGQLSESDTMFK